MNQEIKERWTAALRSGQYKQGTRALRQVNEDGTETHCCLGVLCDLAVEAGVLPEPTLDDGEYKYKNVGQDGYVYIPEGGILPYRVQKWAGLSSGNPDVTVGSDAGFPTNDGIASLAQANDHGFTFDQIADLIDADL